MTDKEKAALAWLDEIADHGLCDDIQPARTLKAMLARLPSPTDHAAIDALAERSGIARGIVALLVMKMHEPPAPATKTVQVWRVEMARWDKLTPQWSAEIMNFGTEAGARECADKLKDGSTHNQEWTRFACIRVTGPHDQEVPIELAPAADGCRGRTLAERRA